MIRKKLLMILYIVIPIAILYACAKVSEVTPREPISATEVKKSASKLETLTDAMVEAWNSGDLEVIQTLYTDDIVCTDATFGDHLVGIDELRSMGREFLQYFPSLRRQVLYHFIGLEESLATFDYWGFSWATHEFTPEDPFLWVHLYQTSGNHFSSWTLLEGLESIEKSGYSVTTGRLDEARSLLNSYSYAWSSGNPNTVSDLYARNAVRDDSLFREHQEGSTAIASFARSFFSWYPNIRWKLFQSFGEWNEDDYRIGGIYATQITDSTNQPCEVLVAVLLKAPEGKITNESLYYEPDSLIKCGWAK